MKRTWKRTGGEKGIQEVPRGLAKAKLFRAFD